MSEEEVQPEEVEEPQAEDAPKANPLFDALFEAADDEGAPPEEPEEIQAPSSLSEALYDIENEVDEPEPEPEPAKEEPQAETGEPPEAARPKRKAKKVKQVIDPEIPNQAPETKVAFSTKEETEEDKIVKELIPEEKEYYELAKFASDNMEEHKDLDKKFLDFFKKSKSYVEKRLKDDPYAELTDDHEYQEFLEKNRPKFSQTDAKQVERKMITRHAEEAAEARVRPEVERLRREQEIAQKKPKIDAQKASFRQNFGVILPEDVQERLKKEGGLEEVQKGDPLAFQVMDSITQNLFTFADAFVDITQGISPYDETNQTHKELLDWVQKEQDAYIQSGETGKDGKTFMRRERFYATPESQRTQYYTWEDGDLLNLLVMRAKQRLDGTLNYQRTMLQNAGYVKSGVSPQPAKAKPVPQQKAPSLSPTPRGNQPAQDQVSKNTPLAILGL